ncbi:hypothetical protein FD13_GL001786 [Levilactobacillus senmaizukei DSM 21775 = NBRC 103853]|uniref:Helicase Helix-turn-helix domain-containing protein n=1 Tax=Levilactobacillus senmaizukei DSM 21775 = NBRC 103853 TaxID=1423803 RepID=A0A0R2DGU7_9LACO|nr:helix-turn-helix domain-containing protein [Levilactobacillus senmaizukei]KRN02563.1 hypothetical protein FD13_GL001786 [Levilactobacillus senmaizukei DSM 21775 = NBRC 103853]
MGPTDLLQLLDRVQPRRVRAIENLLRGRRTVSTLYWGQRYQLLPLLNLAKQLDRGALDAAAQQVVHQGLATWDINQERLVLTPAGLSKQRADHYFVPQTADCWPTIDLIAVRQRILLAVQVASQFSHQAGHYLPLTTDMATRQFVRHWFHQVKNDQLGPQVLTALMTSLDKLDPVVATVMTAQFTGYQQAGQTLGQLALAYQRTEWEIQLMQFEGLAQIMGDAKEPTNPFNSLLQPLWQTPVSRSAQITLNTVKQGQTLAQIAGERRVKVSTVREHLLEAAIMLPLADFPYDRLLSPAARSQFKAVVSGPVDDWQYTGLPEALQRQYEFFYFRLYAIWVGKRGALHD